MNSAILFIVFLICFVLGLFIVKWVETLIKRKKAYRLYINRLEIENKKLKRTVNFLSLELQTREV